MPPVELQSLLKFMTNVLSSRQDQPFTNSKGLLRFSNAVSHTGALSADTFGEVVAFNNCF